MLHHRVVLFALLFPVALGTVSAQAQDTGDHDMRRVARLDTTFNLALALPQTDTASSERSDDDGDLVPSIETVPAFGAEGSWRLHFQAGGGVDIDETSEWQAFGGVALSYFFVENLSLDFELNGIFFSQPTDDAIAANFNLLFRWHFVAKETWSIYVDGGAGLMVASEEVPPGGTNFNFTPQAGIGGSFEISDNTRLLIGARWHHVSNGSTSRDNPGKDAIIAYGAVSLPF